MAPTISATSKAVAASPSPRKKILGERNNDAAHPIASSPGDLLAHGKPRGPPPPPPIEEALGAPRRLRLSLDGSPAPPPTAIAPCLGEVEVEKPMCKVHDEPGDAAAPYDPKTNFLSPRPQYLRYKPNPRVEQYRRSGSMRRLEDGFPSESSDDTTTTEEEGLSEEEHESSALASASDAGADPVVTVAAGILQPEPAPVSPPPRAPAPNPEEPAPTSPPARAPTPELQPAANPAPAPAEKKKKKRSSALRFLLVPPLVLVMFIAASFVCVPSPTGSPVMPLPKVSDYLLSVQELHPVELAAWLKQWSSSSFDFVTSYLNALASSREQEFFGPHSAANLSAAVADEADDGVGFYYTAAISARIFQHELEIQEVVSAGDTVNIAESEVQEMVSLGDAAVQEMVVQEPTGDGFVVEEVLNAETAEEVLDSSGEEMPSSSYQDLDIPSQSKSEPAQILDDTDVPSLQQDVQIDESQGDQEAPENDQEAQHGQKLGSDIWSGYSDKLSKSAVAGSVLAVLIVSAALTFHYMRTNEPVEQESAEQVEEAAQELVEQVEEVEQEPVEQLEQVENLIQEAARSILLQRVCNFRILWFKKLIRLVALVPRSTAAVYHLGLAGGGRTRVRKFCKVLSQCRGESPHHHTAVSPHMRRSLPKRYTYLIFSNLVCLFTYANVKFCFVPQKKEDEAMTPVRRSSRLRNNQVKSPEA
ncbi:hypothetical protein PR202_gb11457 [Eleusine coracana subsp. coracana]|uniref:Uncharacterized protein n=1 Tax=Eleusine coracana subsp. coracana TaxID=191504 RepID=A0AAV5EM04_ELECO|nr:hypothetical protein PR202_gb11457 [Eleusine coracana subsp. coracana]